jgi:hypothetical protein
MFKRYTVTLLGFEKNEENLILKKEYLFKFVDSNDHCAPIRYLIPSSFILLESSLQDPSSDA